MPISAERTFSRRAALGAPLALIATPTAPGQWWTAVQSMPVPRSEMGAAVLNGKITVAGGFDGGTQVDRYDPAADRWETLGPLPEAVNHGGIVAWHGQVITCGGYNAEAMAAMDIMHTWDEDALAWKSIGTLPTPIGAFGLAVLNDVLYLAGGAIDRLGGEAMAAVWKRETVDGPWIACPPLSAAREHLTLVACGSDLVAIGGRAAGQNEATLGAIVERWDGTADHWERMPDLPVPRSGLAGCAVGSSILVAGGETATAVFATVNRFQNKNWSTWHDLPTPVHGMALAAVGTDLFALGGSTEAGAVASVATVYRANITR
ncbi:MAG TPA: hypothetical protein PK819_00160 [Thermomicrobiales bacterium]|nr:hypothetical protein [Thermomicrobiales bacterium]